MAKFGISETIYSEKVKTVRLAAGTNTASAANTYGDEEVGKAVKLSADSRYVLCTAGDAIEGVITSMNLGRQDDYSIGGIVSTGYKNAVLDGLQATPGTGAVAIGDYVVVGTVVAKGTALPAALKVTKATDQAAAKAAPFKARVVAASGTAVGSTAVIELF